MNEFRARIGRVRMKNGGADVRVIEGFSPPKAEAESVAGAMLRASRDMAEEGPIGAFLTVAFTESGGVLFNWKYTAECGLSRTLMVPYIAELARRYLLTREEASECFNDMFKWVE
jgi:hypothetical protein